MSEPKSIYDMAAEWCKLQKTATSVRGSDSAERRMREMVIKSQMDALESNIHRVTQRMVDGWVEGRVDDMLSPENVIRGLAHHLQIG